MDYTKTSKFISLILRHDPLAAGIKLDENGWANVSELLAGMGRKGHSISMEVLEDIVATNNKKRFSLSEDKTKIRTNQGHSIDVDVELKVVIPPTVLYHGTADRFCDEIRKNGLQKQSRNHVHLSADKETAVMVGRRHGKPIVLCISAGAMHEAGYTFYLSENGVWLTDCVPVKYIKF